MANEDAAKEPTTGSGEDWDHSSREEFFEYYARESTSPRTVQRYAAIRDTMLHVHRRENPDRGDATLRVADIGCGAGTQCMMWAELGHKVHGLDVNAPLVELARKRAGEEGREIAYEIGSASELPWNDASFDVCLVPELLEHVREWQVCVAEFVRILRPGGVLFLSTTNKLCPRQQEFNLPLYSWYPGFLKRRYERLAMTTRPDLVNHATYPAVNWFSYYALRDHLDGIGMTALDRFDVMDLSRKGALAGLAVRAIRAVPVLRWLGHVATPFTATVAVKRPARER
jgi:2-polyprenyl-6-hydroxyphenyl methylase/3-demethylubiquinone-9 3-methyltransferase